MGDFSLTGFPTTSITVIHTKGVANFGIATPRILFDISGFYYWGWVIV